MSDSPLQARRDSVSVLRRRREERILERRPWLRRSRRGRRGFVAGGRRLSVVGMGVSASVLVGGDGLFWLASWNSVTAMASILFLTVGRTMFCC